MAVLINLAVALFYPFGDDGDEGMVLIFDILKINYGPFISTLWKMRTESQNPVLVKFIV